MLVTCPGPCYAHLAEFNFEEARRDVEAQILLPLQVARNAASKVRPDLSRQPSPMSRREIWGFGSSADVLKDPGALERAYLRGVPA